MKESFLAILFLFWYYFVYLVYLTAQEQRSEDEDYFISRKKSFFDKAYDYVIEKKSAIKKSIIFPFQALLFLKLWHHEKKKNGNELMITKLGYKRFYFLKDTCDGITCGPRTRNVHMLRLGYATYEVWVGKFVGNVIVK